MKALSKTLAGKVTPGWADVSYGMVFRWANLGIGIREHDHRDTGRLHDKILYALPEASNLGLGGVAAWAMTDNNVKVDWATANGSIEVPWAVAPDHNVLGF